MPDSHSFLQSDSAGLNLTNLEDFASGIRSGVNGTPTFFINEVRYEGRFDVESLLAGLTAVEGA